MRRESINLEDRLVSLTLK